MNKIRAVIGIFLALICAGSSLTLSPAVWKGIPSTALVPFTILSLLFFVCLHFSSNSYRTRFISSLLISLLFIASCIFALYLYKSSNDIFSAANSSNDFDIISGFSFIYFIATIAYAFCCSIKDNSLSQKNTKSPQSTSTDSDNEAHEQGVYIKSNDKLKKSYDYLPLLSMIGGVIFVILLPIFIVDIFSKFNNHDSYSNSNHLKTFQKNSAYQTSAPLIAESTQCENGARYDSTAKSCVFYASHAEQKTAQLELASSSTTDTPPASSAPKYKDYAVSSLFDGKGAEVMIGEKGTSEYQFRTRLRYAIKQPVNFAGEYVLTAWGCGTECLMGAAINKRTGDVVWLPNIICCWKGEGNMMIGKKDSRLLVLAGRVGEDSPYGVHFYQLTNNRFELVKTTPMDEASHIATNAATASTYAEAVDERAKAAADAALAATQDNTAQGNLAAPPFSSNNAKEEMYKVYRTQISQIRRDCINRVAPEGSVERMDAWRFDKNKSRCWCFAESYTEKFYINKEAYSEAALHDLIMQCDAKIKLEVEQELQEYVDKMKRERLSNGQ